MLSYMNLPLLCAAGAVVMDLNNGKVDNRWSILCLAAGLCAHLIRDGPGGLGEALCGALLPFLLLFWLFTAGMLGAGDIKILCAIGSFLDPEESLRCLAGSFLLGGVFALFSMVFYGTFRARFRYFSDYLLHKRLFLKDTPYRRPGMERPENFHFTLPILGSVFLLSIRFFP